MSLSLDKSADSEFLRFAARFCGISTASAASGPIRLRLAKTVKLYQVNSIAKYFARQADREAELCGQNALEKAQIGMWMDFAIGISKCPPAASAIHWQVLERALQRKTYIAANRVTLADAAIFWAVYEAIKQFSDKQRMEQYVNLVRWFDQVQHTAGVRGFPSRELLPIKRKQLAFTL